MNTLTRSLGRCLIAGNVARRSLAPSTNALLQGKSGGMLTQVRHLNLHEYQSKELMNKYDVRVQKGFMAENSEEALSVANRLVAENAEELILKAQIHAGGRGKGHFDNGFKGGVKICCGADRAQQVGELSKHMFGANLITKQTGPEGQLCQKVLVHEGISFDRELYFAILMDRAHNGPVIVASQQGGMDIEEVAEKDPNAIFTQPVDIKEGIQDSQTHYVATALGFEGEALKDAQTQMKNLYNLFIACDATQVEINPLVETKDGKIFCVDAKINFDENAAYRHKDLFAMRDTSMEDPREVEASKSNLNYVGLDGQIGCMVNGAGLAMATMDIIQLHGGSPANFLDVGGGATEQQVEEAFRLLTSDNKVKGILVNIFGGIMKCDVIAQGIVNAARTLSLQVPLVVRLEGTNVDKGNEILANSGLPIITASDLDDAAIKAVAAISA
mmetsp:Transcript_9631/g.14034  ORF Transcript_9631/g.14034 Transcript_9631/m.14034 type:complete len:444 (+) Transcript_9631:30-1361(+)|eukprot:CAMPEP_0175094040 /NCGR_PEP_ID=MMETSP0086_2-20121207/3361_1 /TAXON_ID=136419 /ORGANISM="Unknown Unknown, Strain D1" /LENGTH=443 /DNA_ID=CAMNT_0016367097 /DNA_START=30 /DNA_END=1361 /DNA_ORIENTATION=-